MATAEEQAPATDAEGATLDDLQAALGSNERLHARFSGQVQGWDAAAAELRRRSGEAFAAGKDEEARTLRRLANELKESPERERMKAQSKEYGDESENLLARLRNHPAYE